MPEHNRFRHQPYPTVPAILPVRTTLSVTNDESVDFSKLHTEHSVRAVMVVHGTFMGDDPFAVSEILDRMADSASVLSAGFRYLADNLREKTKALTSTLSKDVANYSSEFCDRFRQLVGGDPSVEAGPRWTSQNHHGARAELAVRLLVRLIGLELRDDERVLLWGHSHAGNAFAILTNLLANDRESVDRFFAAVGEQKDESWQIARSVLAESGSPHPLAKNVLIAAFGTPVRYGWDPQGYRHLIHILHDRNAPAPDTFFTSPLFPPHKIKDVLNARFGDWVQAFAIAGTDVAAPTSSALNASLAEVLEAGLVEPEHELDTRFITPQRLRNACAWWKTGTRCHSDGHNILVQYKSSGRTTRLGQPVEDAVFGHGVATTIDWLPAHLALLTTTLTEIEAA